jgi:nucleotide-binding universal stress UspA family protein
MPTYLIVANQTLTSDTLEAAVAKRIEDGDARFYVVVPATPVQHGLTWDEDEARTAAAERLRDVLDRLSAQGAEASGEVGSKDPVAAVSDALRTHTADEIILSTLPAGISRWLGMDVPSRLRSTCSVPLTVVTAAREPASTTSA